jgi:hypothetical protein
MIMVYSNELYMVYDALDITKVVKKTHTRIHTHTHTPSCRSTNSVIQQLDMKLVRKKKHITNKTNDTIQ